MPKYSYAPLNVDGRERRRRADEHDDSVINERMPMCIGVCVLLAIVFVLSRSGSDVAMGQQYNSTQVSNFKQSHSQQQPQHHDPEIILNTPKLETPSTTVISTVASDHKKSGARGHRPGSTWSKVDGDDDYIPPSKSEQSLPPIQLYSSNISQKSKDVEFGNNSNCEGLVDPSTVDIGALRAAALAKTTPHIIECAAANDGGDQSKCHLPSKDRYAAVGQKGATLWMTGCSGAGKTTIATALENKLVKLFGKHVYRLDGDNLRTGLNRDLTFSEADRAESVRRTGELATLFADAGVITLVGLISPYRGDRDAVRKRHEDQGIPFYEVFLDVPVDELKKRDPKGQYARVESGELKHFTCIDDPYEEPMNPEITLKTHELAIEESVDILFQRLRRDGILEGAPQLSSPLPNPDGDLVVDLHVPENILKKREKEAESLPKVLLNDIDLNWLQVIGEGWAAPLRGFMREGALLQTLHFNSILVDPFNLTSNALINEMETDFTGFRERQPPQRVSMSVPITLSLTNHTVTEIGDASAVALVTRMGNTVAILRDPEIYENRKEEIVTRMFGVIDEGHPYVQHIYSGGDYLIGGEVELLGRIRYNDGLDQWRKTASELMEEFKAKGADTVYAFQTRNPTHAGHAYLMKSAGEDLKSKGFQNPVLWLSPLGGWTKSDDVPLDVRVHQHEEVLSAGTSHPGGLDPDTTVMAIWPSPMVYAGPTEVQFHAKSRRSAGASYFVVGRDPAGMKGSSLAIVHKDDDLYDGDHGRYVLQMSPGLGDMQVLSFVKVMYDTKDDTMKIPDADRPNDFISISGTKMRALARQGATPCLEGNIPTDLLDANCVPRGFMVPKGWQGVVDYYQNIDDGEWIPYSIQRVAPYTDRLTTVEGIFGTKSFHLKHDSHESLWHDVSFRSHEDDNIIQYVNEIPMYVAAKMELSKTMKGNPIVQDTNDDGSVRYYSYGVPFFNYGFVPQTWEDPLELNSQGLGGDGDPLDLMEVGSNPIPIGSIRSCRILGSLELLDQGEVDYKILCIDTEDPDASRIRSLQDLEKVKPGTLSKVKNWLKYYKTSDGKAANTLASEEPGSIQVAKDIIQNAHLSWKKLCLKSSSGHEFWLDGEGCKNNQYKI